MSSITSDNRDYVDSIAPSSPGNSENGSLLKRLHETIIVQQDQICQASRALAYCRQNEHFRASREEVKALKFSELDNMDFEISH